MREKRKRWKWDPGNASTSSAATSIHDIYMGLIGECRIQFRKEVKGNPKLMALNKD